MADTPADKSILDPGISPRLVSSPGGGRSTKSKRLETIWGTLVPPLIYITRTPTAPADIFNYIEIIFNNTKNSIEQRTKILFE